MKRALWCGLLMVALALPLAEAAAQTDSTRYNVSFQGRPSGSLVVSREADRRVVTDFSYRDNGRGPDIHEEMRLATDGHLLDYRTKGTSTFGAPLAESFERSGGKVRWSSTADHGEAADDASAVYVPLEGSPEASALLARSLLRNAQGRGAAFPAGQLAVRKLAETHLASGQRSADVALYAVSGISFYPNFVWLKNDASQRYFADVYPGYQTIEAGFEAEGERLLALQLAAEKELLQTLAARLAHPLEDLLVIRDVRVFDAEHAGSWTARGRVRAPWPHRVDAARRLEALGQRPCRRWPRRALLPGLFDMHAHAVAVERRAAHRRRASPRPRHGQRQRHACTLIERHRRRQELLGPHIIPAGFIEGEEPVFRAHGFVIKNLEEAKPRSTGTRSTAIRRSRSTTRSARTWSSRSPPTRTRYGMRVSGHIPAFMRAQEAVEQGYDEIQHINQLLLNFFVDAKTDTRTLQRFTCLARQDRGPRFRQQAGAGLHRAAGPHGTVLDPTLATFEFIHQRDGEMRRVSPQSPTTCRRTCARAPAASEMKIPDDATRRALHESYDKMVEFVGRAVQGRRPARRRHRRSPGFTLHASSNCTSRPVSRRRRRCRSRPGTARKYAGCSMTAVDRGRQARRPDPRRRRPDAEHRRHPQGGLVLKDGRFTFRRRSTSAWRAPLRRSAAHRAHRARALKASATTMRVPRHAHRKAAMSLLNHQVRLASRPVGEATHANWQFTQGGGARRGAARADGEVAGEDAGAVHLTRPCAAG